MKLPAHSARSVEISRRELLRFTFSRTLAAVAAGILTLDLKSDQIVELTLQDYGKDVILSIYTPDGPQPIRLNELLQVLLTGGGWFMK
jgi:hypothetical protein